MWGAGVEGPPLFSPTPHNLFLGAFRSALIKKHYFRVLQNVARLLLGFQFFSFKVQLSEHFEAHKNKYLSIIPFIPRSHLNI